MTTVRPSPPDRPVTAASIPTSHLEPRLTPVEELQIAYSIGTSFQTAINQADSKVNVLLVVYLATATMVVSQPVGGVVRHGNGVGVALLAADLACFAICGAVALVCLVRALHPRIAVDGHPNPFAFPTVAAASGPAASSATVAALVASAWRHNRILATIATGKNRLIIKAIKWTCGMVVTAAAHLVITAGWG